MMLLVRSRAILILQLSSRTRTCSLICCICREHFCLNFHVRWLPILFIWPNDTTRKISRNSETPKFFALFNLPMLPGALRFEFSRAIFPILFILRNGTTHVILLNSETPSLFARALAPVSLLLHLEVLIFEFSCAIVSNIIYLA